MDGHVVSAERTIAAPPEVVFDYLADAAKHPLIDGSGTVRAAEPGAPQRLALGSVFGMSMRAGMSYSMVNTVIEFEENRRIAWQGKPRGLPGLVIGGRIWRYVLEPVEGGTHVTESWDISRDKQRLLFRFGGLPERTAANMEKTLERIAELVTAASG